MGFVTSENVKEYGTDAFKERSKDAGDKDLSSDGKESIASVSLPNESASENDVVNLPASDIYPAVHKRGPFEIFSF